MPTIYKESFTMRKHFYTVTLDNMRQKHMWASDEDDVRNICAVQYPEAEITNIHLNNRDPRDPTPYEGING